MTSDVKHSLLPATATPLAKALDLLEERLFGLPAEMIAKDPQVVDVGWLDHLAWEHSVDVWDPLWPEDVKRRVIAFSEEVHRYKGTPYAIRKALAAFDVDTELLEWFEPEGVEYGLDRGCFRVTAYAGASLYGDTENTLDTRMIHAMNSVVQRVAPVSRGLTFRLGERFETSGYLRSHGRAAHLHRDSHDPQMRPAPSAVVQPIRTGCQVQRIWRDTQDPTGRPTPAPFDMHLRTGLHLRVVSRETHQVTRRAVS